MAMSLVQSPTVSTRTRTSPGPGAGTGMVPGASRPGPVTTMAGASMATPTSSFSRDREAREHLEGTARRGVRVLVVIPQLDAGEPGVADVVQRRPDRGEVDRAVARDQVLVHPVG